MIPVVDFSCKLPVTSVLDTGSDPRAYLGAIQGAGFDTACVSVEGHARDMAILPGLHKGGILVGLPYFQLPLFEEYQASIDYTHITISKVSQLETLPMVMAKVADIGVPLFVFVSPAKGLYSIEESQRAAVAGLQGDDGLLETLTIACIASLAAKYAVETLALGITKKVKLGIYGEPGNYLSLSANAYNQFSLVERASLYSPWLNVSPPIRGEAEAAQVREMLASGEVVLSSGHTFLPADASLLEFDQTQIGADTYTLMPSGGSGFTDGAWQETNRRVYERLFPGRRLDTPSLSLTKSVPSEASMDYSLLVR